MTIELDVFNLVDSGAAFKNTIDTSVSDSAVSNMKSGFDNLLQDPVKMAKLEEAGITDVDLREYQDKLSGVQEVANKLNSHVGESLSQINSKLSLASSYTNIMKRLGSPVAGCDASSSLLGSIMGGGGAFLSSLADQAAGFMSLIEGGIDNVQEWVGKFNGLVSSIMAIPSQIEDMINAEIQAMRDMLNKCVAAGLAFGLGSLLGDDCAAAVLESVATPEMGELMGKFKL